MSTFSRLLLALASVLLLGGLATPLWRIHLVAPQYPEGLGMVIRAHTVHGEGEHDLANINKLNHYIGMKPITPRGFPEFRVIPWVVAGLAALGLGAALVGRRDVAIAWFGTLLLAGIAGLVTFWRWTYEYGHDLDVEHAIIKVPGMTYQPPILGSKQLLNFTAESWPALGGVLVVLAVVLGLIAVVGDRHVAQRLSHQRVVPPLKRVAALVLLGCAAGAPRPIAYDHDACEYCRMVISDPRFGAELVTTKGKAYTFDSIECLARYYRQAAASGTVQSVWVSDFRRPGTLIPAETARFLRVQAVATPMGRGWLAVSSERDAAVVQQTLRAEVLTWSHVVADAARGVERAS